LIYVISYQCSFGLYQLRLTRSHDEAIDFKAITINGGCFALFDHSDVLDSIPFKAVFACTNIPSGINLQWHTELKFFKKIHQNLKNLCCELE
jgi:hypothetical protein